MHQVCRFDCLGEGMNSTLKVSMTKKSWDSNPSCMANKMVRML